MRLTSWIDSANQPGSEFPIQNLPYGVFRSGSKTAIGIAIGNKVLDLHACAERGLLAALPSEIVGACSQALLNPLMSLGQQAWSTLRRHITAILSAERSGTQWQDRVEQALIAMDSVQMQMPVRVGDYTDFYASLHHATRAGRLLRPESPLLPNYKHIPIGYHGRASSIVVSGTGIARPSGQTKGADGGPVFGPSQSLDYELEVGVFIGTGNSQGKAIPIAETEQHIFGLCLLNDWSARDMQAWEYQPLGPFLAKSFATTISPWVVPMEALAPYRTAVAARAQGDPTPLPYLTSPTSQRDGIDIALRAYLESAQMREKGFAPVCITTGANLREQYWSIAQLLAHQTSNGCNLQPGDMLGTGTISGADEGAEGCLLEKKLGGEPIRLPTGEQRTFLEDGDRVILRGHAEGEGLPRIGFGQCEGTVMSAV